VSYCTLTHACAVCGASCLQGKHETRGDAWTKAQNILRTCPTNFKVRCIDCTEANKLQVGQLAARDVGFEQRTEGMQLVFDLV
jgi:hypothetical protein